MRTSAAVALFATLVFASRVLGGSYSPVTGADVDPFLCVGTGPSCPGGTGTVHPFSGPHLRIFVVVAPGAVLDHALLPNAWLFSATLPGADLRSADLSTAVLTLVDLSGADLSGANLSGAQLAGTNLSGANLSGANLTAEQLVSADLTGANLSGADLNGAINLDLSSGSASYDSATKLANAWAGQAGGTLFDPVAAGWVLLDPLPISTSAAVLTGLALLGLAAFRRRKGAG